MIFDTCSDRYHQPIFTNTLYFSRNRSIKNYFLPKSGGVKNDNFRHQHKPHFAWLLPIDFSFFQKKFLISKRNFWSRVQKNQFPDFGKRKGDKKLKILISKKWKRFDPSISPGFID